MSTSVKPATYSAEFKPSPWQTSRLVLLAVGLVVWLGLSAIVGANGYLTAGSGVLFRPILLSIAVPVAVFLTLYARSASFRAFILSRDMRFVTSLQHWRVVGFAFILLYAEGVLPGLFAWPAAVGDIAVGLTTPFVLLALARSKEFATSRKFVAWNIFGLLDFRRCRNCGHPGVRGGPGSPDRWPDERSYGGVAFDPVPEFHRPLVHLRPPSHIVSGSGA